MACSSKRYPKLRFALITEDALEMLRPENKTPDPNLMEVKDMYETINNTVNVVVEQKLRHLKLDRLDQLIEDKVNEIHERHREIRKTYRTLKTPKTSVSEMSSGAQSELENPARPKQHKVIRPKKFSKELFSTNFTYKSRKKGHENRPTSTNDKTTSQSQKSDSANRNAASGNIRRKKSLHEIPLQSIKDKDDRCKRK